MSVPHIAFIYGLNESALSDGHGLATLEKRMRDAGWTVTVDGWDGDVVAHVQSVWHGDRPLAIVSHSFGGGKAVEIASQFPAIAHLFLLNPVPYKFPWYLIPSPTDFVLPDSVKAATQWWRNSWIPPWECRIRKASCPFTNNVTKDSHSGICGDQDIQNLIFKIVADVAAVSA